LSAAGSQNYQAHQNKHNRWQSIAEGWKTGKSGTHYTSSIQRFALEVPSAVMRKIWKKSKLTGEKITFALR
jgi:hypothetical protein